jgi:hypothetical protein
MLDGVQAMGTAAMVNRTAATGAGAGGGAGAGELSEEVAAEWLVALENSGGTLAAAAAALRAESAEVQVEFKR